MNHSELILKRLYFFLREKNMTINKLADVSGIRQSTLSNMVNRKSVPKVDMLYKICEALDISLQEFFDFEPYSVKPRSKKQNEIESLIQDVENLRSKLEELNESLKKKG
ncbi:helix-turn-helix domain-containing protein [Enterococcus raffinosus]|uniref:Helix-turn-helix transcriptional regulator n=1 Tax=Enterococcus raffinosus TaxID=71452 RepID=A0AAW8TGK4_9ENTE|nr:helix-turn-helix transcriptional regulator [Enterococcus raffinosus]MDT2546899.1 helix-turn-helix transcriptional regulator [Enterococcus raffinosus]MDT2555312.1 helix-turn-helix transcriptional regulator [Enterococcus raffinosus]